MEAAFAAIGKRLAIEIRDAARTRPSDFRATRLNRSQLLKIN
jgi:hypothetical protein